MGVGGLSGLFGEKIKEPNDKGYEPEASFTGDIKGPMVPSNQPETDIVEQVERRPLNAPGDPTREQMQPLPERPKRVKHLSYKEIKTIMMDAESGWIPKQSRLSTVMDFLRVLSPGNWLDLAIATREYQWAVAHPRDPTIKPGFLVRNVAPFVVAYLAVCVAIRQERLAQK